MPTIETIEGKVVTPPDVEAGAAAFQAANDGVSDGDGPGPDALPKRDARGPAVQPKPKPARQPKAEKSRTTSRPATVLTPDKRREGVKSLAQVAAVIPLGLAKAARDDKAKADAYKADAVAIASAADGLADACAEVAEQDPKFAAALDKVCATGPYGALITAVFGLGAQLFRNHRPKTAIPGTVDPAELVKAQDKAEAARVPAAA